MSFKSSPRNSTNGADSTTSHPAGVTVSRALVIRAGVANDDLRDAVIAINRVHGDGDLPEIPVSLRRNLGYQNGQSVDGLFRVEQTSDGRLEARSIQIRDGASHRAFVTLHEVGHLLDLHGLPGTGFASADREMVELVSWRRAVARSQAVELLTMLCQSSDRRVRRRALFLITPEELWARSYAQFVVTRSGVERIQFSLDALRSRDPRNAQEATLDTVYFPRQWEDEDFTEIDAVVEELFRRLGWIE